MTKTTRDQWVEQIAIKTKKSTQEIDALLKRHGIEPRPTHAVPKRLQILALDFEGRKTGNYETQVFKFSKKELETGLHAFVSDRNLKGKTSLLKIIRWALTGSRGLPTDMAGWFHTLALRFRLDSDEYEIRLDDAEIGQGRLLKFARGREFTIAEFADMDGFHEAMDQFFLQELGLETLDAVVKRADGSAVEQRHGWNWLFGAMWIDPNPVTLFGGDDTTHNKPTKMMQMYLGLPWIMTRASLMDAKKRATIDIDQQTKAARQVSDAAAVRLKELVTARGKLVASQVDETPLVELRARLSEALRQYSSGADKVRRTIPATNEIEAARRSAEEAVTSAIRQLNAFVESRAAGHIFRRLNPVSCPSCEEAFTDDVREERQHDHDCVVCGRAERRDADDPAGTEAELRDTHATAKEEAKRLRVRVADANRRKFEAEAERDRHDHEARRLEAEIEVAQSKPNGQIEIIKLDAQIEELEKMVTEDKGAVLSDADLLEAAIDATKKMYEDEQADVLGRVSVKIADFARAFGLSDLLEVRLKGNTHMDVVMKGGTKRFGGCTDGEKTRLKIASALAMIHVAEESGIGRHPGVLLIDSVGSHEVINEDVSQIVTGLAGLTEVLPSIQIFIAGIASDAILAHVPCGNVVKNREDGYLW